MVGDMNVSPDEYDEKHSPQVIRDARLVYGLLMESMTGYAFAEFRMQQAKSPSGAWQELENYYMPRTLAATHRLKRERTPLYSLVELTRRPMNWRCSVVRRV